MSLVNPRCTMRRLAIFLALLAPSVGLAADRHSVEIHMEPSMDEQMDDTPQTLRLAASASGIALDEATTTVSTSIRYTFDDERTLWVDADRDPTFEGGLSVVERTQGSSCGDAIDTDIATFAQVQIERNARGRCDEQRTEESEGTVDDSDRSERYYTMSAYSAL
jgi:hypothetical protein